jgi:V8-like Glu-specific endopeptidase
MKWIVLLLLALSGCAEGHPSTALRITFASGGLCSATAVGPDLLLSAQHCFDGDRLTTINGEPAYALKLVKDGNDHVLVRVSKKFKRWAVIGQNPKVTQHAVLWGNPSSMPSFMYRECYVAAAQSHQILWSGCETFEGDSGGGLLVGNRVVGVITGARRVINKEGWQLVVVWTMPLAFTDKQMREMYG